MTIKRLWGLKRIFYRSQNKVSVLNEFSRLHHVNVITVAVIFVSAEYHHETIWVGFGRLSFFVAVYNLQGQNFISWRPTYRGQLLLQQQRVVRGGRGENFPFRSRILPGIFTKPSQWCNLSWDGYSVIGSIIITDYSCQSPFPTSWTLPNRQCL